MPDPHDNPELGKLRQDARRLNRAGSWDEEAMRVNSRILELDPRDVAALTRRARCRRTLKQFEGAMEDYRRALELSPAHPHIPQALDETKREADAYEEEKQKTREKELKERRRLDEARTFAAAYRLARDAKRETPPDYRRVIPALEKALTLATRGSRNSVQVELAATYRKAKELRKARVHYDTVIDRNPDYTPGTHWQSGLTTRSTPARTRPLPDRRDPQKRSQKLLREKGASPGLVNARPSGRS